MKVARPFLIRKDPVIGDACLHQVAARVACVARIKWKQQSATVPAPIPSSDKASISWKSSTAMSSSVGALGATQCTWGMHSGSPAMQRGFACAESRAAHSWSQSAKNDSEQYACPHCRPSDYINVPTHRDMGIHQRSLSGHHGTACSHSNASRQENAVDKHVNGVL